ncbi:2Fe-2S iron-sulfur cluster binding domain-containing protein [Verticiella sediminum]|uniref:2Fe-2S iron-sulfur cluster binding domain-containing protein n=1 Tax=Verticiella sediminum TaxID=1247510 RepID=A0A556AD26_9BURK|nr:2Fe-2S iron-sulfur cluster-binding protein [Verticiella sediminum]TSH90790.1 2Fe-2S iron-sulfur cluster binding domain-containing protein [Verticiella sediminum]
MTHRVQIQETGAMFVVQPGETVLEAGLRAGVAMAHECQFGGCGTCRVRVIEGEVGYDDMPMALVEEEAAAGFALACQARPHSDLVLSTARNEPCAEPVWTQAEVQEVAALAGDVLHVRLAFAADIPAHRPGQYLKLRTPVGERSFSMASPPRGREVDLHVRCLPDGRFTSGVLRDWRPGTPVEVELPHGDFYFRARDDRPLIMAVTGTGLAPVKSILEGLMDDDACPPVWLYRGARTESDLYLNEAVAGWGERLCEFTYVPVLSRAQEDWPGRRGHVQDAIVQDFPDLSEFAIYLCGSPDMIHDARQRFLQHGAHPLYMYADAFTFQR